MRLMWTLCILLAMAIQPAFGAEMYVSNSGNNDTGNGSEEAPFQTVSHALTQVADGDSIILRGGSYSEDLDIRTPNLTIMSYPGEWAVVTTPIDDEEMGSCVYIRIEAAGLLLQRLELVGGYYYVVMTESEWGWGDPDNIAAKNITLDGCKIHGSGRDCVKLTPGSDNVTISNCEIYESGLRDDGNAEGIDNVNADNMIVRNTHIHDIATTGIYAKGGATDCLIERCLIRNVGGLGIAVGFDTSPEWFDTDVNPGYYENINGLVRNNIIINTVYASIGLYASQNGQVYNNTVVNAATEGQSAVYFGIAFHDWEDGIPRPGNVNPTIRNNIFVSAEGGMALQVRYTDELEGLSALQGAAAMSNNLYQTPGATARFEDMRPGSEYEGDLAGWMTHMDESASLEGDPGFGDSYHLGESSICRGAGRSVATVSDDYDGDGRTDGYDIGADQYNPANVLQVPPPEGVIGTGYDGGNSDAEPEPDHTDCYLFFHNQENGEVCFWRLRENGKLGEVPANRIWGRVSRTPLIGGWSIAGVMRVGTYNTLFLHNAVSGRVAYWKTENGRIVDTEKDSGWGWVSESARVSDGWRIAGMMEVGGTPTLFWQHSDLAEVVYWRLGDDCKLLSDVQGEGWDWVRPEGSGTGAWRLLETASVNGTPALFWQNSRSGTPVYWRLGADAHLLNDTQGDGWGYVMGIANPLPGWGMLGVTELGGVATMLWKNSSSGRVCYWRLDNGCELGGEGWGWASSLALPDDWGLKGEADIGGRMLFWQNRTNGNVVFWRMEEGGTLVDHDKDSGWGYVCESVRLGSAWSLMAVAE